MANFLGSEISLFPFQVISLYVDGHFSPTLHYIIILFTYRPKTPSRKDSDGSGGSPSRKISNTSVESYDSPDLMTRSLSRCSNSSRKNEGSVNGRKKISYSGTKSLGRSSGISFLKDLEHTVVKLN